MNIFWEQIHIKLKVKIVKLVCFSCWILLATSVFVMANESENDSIPRVHLRTGGYSDSKQILSFIISSKQEDFIKTELRAYNFNKHCLICFKDIKSPFDFAWDTRGEKLVVTHERGVSIFEELDASLKHYVILEDNDYIMYNYCSWGEEFIAITYYDMKKADKRLVAYDPSAMSSSLMDFSVGWHPLLWKRKSEGVMVIDNKMFLVDVNKKQPKLIREQVDYLFGTINDQPVFRQQNSIFIGQNQLTEISTLIDKEGVVVTQKNILVSLPCKTLLVFDADGLVVCKATSRETIRFGCVDKSGDVFAVRGSDLIKISVSENAVHVEEIIKLTELLGSTQNSITDQACID